MISFKQFILEQEKFKVQKFKSFEKHIHDLGDNHELHVHFEKKVRDLSKPDRNLEGDNHFNTSFYLVNKKTGEGSYDRAKRNIDTRTKVQATLKICNSIDSFIKKRRPRSIEMNGNTEGKKKIYAKLGNAIARKHGGKRHLTSSNWSPGNYLDGTSDTTMVEFPRHQKSKS